MKRSNLITSIGGFVGLFSGLPIIWGTAVKDGAVHTPMPGWLYLFCMCALPLSVGIIGVAAKGQDEHSTFDQVEKSSTAKAAEFNPTVAPPPAQVP